MDAQDHLELQQRDSENNTMEDAEWIDEEFLDMSDKIQC